MSLKLNNKVDWRQSEILEASKLLEFALADIPVYFFTLITQSQLIDTNEFIQELTDGRELTAHGYLFTADEFNQFCLARNLQPRLVKRHLYDKGRLEATKEANGKVNYSIMLWIDGVSQRRIAIKA